ncbi:MAG: TetR/AcrR family transcriptional regulator [Stenotrophobium sp.]
MAVSTLKSRLKPPPADCGAAVCMGQTQILGAAIDLFAAQGYDAVSVSQIAAHAGVSKANVYHHFESKQALYLAVLRTACDEHAGRVEVLLDDPAPSAEKLLRLLTTDLRAMFSTPQVPRLITREITHQGPQGGKLLAEQVLRRNFVAVLALFHQGQARGEFRADLDAAVATALLKATTVFFFQSYEVLRHHAEFAHAMSPDRYAELASDLLLRGLLAEPRQAGKAARGRSAGTTAPADSARTQ